MVCEKCRKIIPNDSDFCPHCGQKQEKANTEKEYVVNDNKNNTVSELSTNRKIIGIAITVIIFLVLGIGIHHYKQEQVKTSKEVATQTENVTKEESSNSNKGENRSVEQAAYPILLPKQLKDEINAIPMGEEKYLLDLHFKIAQDAHITLSENKNIIVEYGPEVKYRISILDLKGDYPKNLTQFSMKQAEELIKEFIYIYKRDRAQGYFFRNWLPLYNDNNVYMLRQEAFVPDENYDNYKASFYIMYHNGICYVIEINEGIREYKAALSYLASDAFVHSLIYR